jgi:primosomal protein N' (replication factor Y)
VAKGPKDQAVSERLPVARVAVDISLAHLDRPFDYLVPASLDQAAVPGCRVRVRFAGQLVDGYLLDRTQTSEHQGRLARIERVISPEAVLTPEIFTLSRAVADRYAGTLADVLRLAIPPRHATAEREAPPRPANPRPRRARAGCRSAGPRVVPARAWLLDPVPGRRGVPGRAGRGPPGPGRLVGAARSRMAG